MSKDVERAQDELKNYLPFMTQGKAESLADNMINASGNFVEKLITWVCSTFTEISARTMKTKKEVWALISACVRTILELLYEARSSGGKFTEDNKLERMTWGMLKARVVQDQLIKFNFSAHPAVSHTLNVHLQDNSVPRSAHEALAKKVEELSKKVQEQSKLVHKLQSNKS